MSLTIANIRQRLRQILTSSQSANDKDQVKACVRLNGLLDDILQFLCDPVSRDVIEMLEAIVETFVGENVSLVNSRQIFNNLTNKVLPVMNVTQSKSLALFMLDKMGHRTVFFEEQVSNIRLHLSAIYEKDRNWKDAVLMLVASLLESGQTLYSIDYKLSKFIKIANLYLLDNNPSQAESYINRASILQSEDEHLQVCYELTHAHVLDFRHRFIEAAHIYNELSYRSNITESERIISLDRAVVCTILSPAGKPRFQMLKKLYKDERCQPLIRFSILKKLYLCRLIKPDEVDQIETMLLPHQRAKTKYNTSLLTEAILEHNVLSISKLYKNIKINSLASILKVDPYKAETIAAKMISEERMKGSIDQIDGFIHFKSQNELNLIPTWDKEIKSLCCHVNRIFELMNADSSTREWINEYLENQMSL